MKPWQAIGLALWACGCATTSPTDDRITAVHFESGAGRPAFEVQPQGASVEVLDASGRLLVRLLREGDAVVALDQRGGRVGQVRTRPDDDGIILEWSDTGSPPSYGLEREADGDLELEDAAGETLYELKRRDYGFKVVDASGESRLRVRFSDSGKISVRDANDLTYLTTRDPLPIEAAAVWSLPSLPFTRASALAVALWLVLEQGS